jgi:hypothetical protein
MNPLNEVKKKIQKLGYTSHGLKTADGKWILKPNGPRKESNLDQIFSMLETLPPDNYVVYCTKAGTRAGYDYPVPTNGSFGATMLQTSQPATQPNPDAERLGRLEAENAFLREQVESLKKELEECNLEDDDQDFGLADDEPELPQQSGLMEALAPAVPALVDKALALMDNFINRNKPQQLSEGPKAINYDQLAEIVVQKIMANQPQPGDDQE